MSAEQIYTREELFTRQRLMIWAAVLVAALGVGAFTTIQGRKEAVVARAQQAAEQERLEKQRAVEAEKMKQQQAQVQRAAADSAKFEEAVRTLNHLPDLRNAAGRGYIRGKIVVIDKDEGGVDAINGALPSELTAKRASEIGTVVWVKRGKVPAAKLRIDGALQAQSYINTYTVTVIDMTTKTIVASRFFKSDDPDTDPDGYGLYSIAYYLLDLPRR